MRLDRLGGSGREFLVAAEAAPEGGAELFFRENGEVRSERAEFHPFMLLADSADLNGFEGDFEVEPLAGDAVLRFLATFASMRVHDDAVAFLRDTAKTRSVGPRQIFSDPINQILISRGLRLYRGMRFSDVRRMQFDLETVCGGGREFPNPKCPEDEIVIISVTDSHGFEQVLSQGGCSEKELLEKFVAVVAERNPDVIEGHNICRFDLPYLEERCKRHKVELKLGRDGSTFKKRKSVFYAAERTVNYTRYDFYGRSVVDTYFLAQFYDVTTRSLESFNLKYLARHFNVAPPDRTYVPGEKITETWRNDPEKLLAYALDDARECGSVSSLLLPSYFFMTQLVPLKLQDCLVRGKATVIDHMLTAAYFTRKQSMPLPEQPVAFAGALTVSPQTGVFRDVSHCDVRSLYPSIILAEKWSPKRDKLGEFVRLLSELRDFRLEAKDAAKTAATAAERDYFGALQSTFKILINSFYGYLGSSQATFNDFAMAERITAKGREILRSMLDYLAANGCTVLEADTDGVYFTRPDSHVPPEEWLARLQAILPPGIAIDLDAQYDAMFCYKSKNYALLTAAGELEIAGAALKSRGLEPFQRELMEVLLHALLHQDIAPFFAAYGEAEKAIADGKMPVEKLAKTENLKDSVAVYRKKLADGSGRRSAVYELAAAAKQDYLAGDQLTYYVTGSKAKIPVVGNARLLSDAPEPPDYNRAYYLNKLAELRGKFAEFLPEPAVDPDNFSLSGD